MIRRSWFLVLALSVAVLLFLVLGLAHLRLRAAESRLPERGRSARAVKGCPALVEVVFDRRGAPHVYSGSGSAVWFAQGYLHARDRFFQMDLTRRKANGRLAELFGEGALDNDRKMRILRIAASARRQAATALAHVGFELVITGSTARSFRRNAANHGLLCVESPDFVKHLQGNQPGARILALVDPVAVDFTTATLRYQDREFTLVRPPALIQEFHVDGGVLGRMRRRFGNEGGRR